MKITQRKVSVFIVLVSLTATVAYMLILADFYGGISQLALMEIVWPSLPYLILFALIVFTKGSALKKQGVYVVVAILMAFFAVIVSIGVFRDPGAMRALPALPLLVIPLFQFVILIVALIVLPFIKEEKAR